jgi:hypothetical protein
MLLSVENATIAALGLMVTAVAARTVTSAMLGGMKKSLDEIRQKLYSSRSDLGFESERRQSQTDLLSFNERQKVDLLRRIEITKNDIEILAAEFDEKPKAAAETEAEAGSGEDRGDPKVPRHMRSRGESLFGE